MKVTKQESMRPQRTHAIAKNVCVVAVVMYATVRDISLQADYGMCKTSQPTKTVTNSVFRHRGRRPAKKTRKLACVEKKPFICIVVQPVRPRAEG